MPSVDGARRPIESPGLNVHWRAAHADDVKLLGDRLVVLTESAKVNEAWGHAKFWTVAIGRTIDGAELLLRARNSEQADEE